MYAGGGLGNGVHVAAIPSEPERFSCVAFLPLAARGYLPARQPLPRCRQAAGRPFAGFPPQLRPALSSVPVAFSIDGHQWRITANTGGNVLKEMLISAVLIPFTPRRRAVDKVAFNRIGAVDLTPIPEPVPPPMTVAGIDAVRAFLGEMMEYAAGDTVRLQHVFHSYHQLAPARGWPGMSTKALSMHLVAMGCRRRQMDLRRRGEGRPTAIEFPVTLTPVKKRRRSKR